MAKITTTSKRLIEYMRIFDKRQVDIIEEVQPLCEELGTKLNKSDLSQYISGKVEPGSDKVYLLSVALGLNPAWLMGYDVEMYQQGQGPAPIQEKPADQHDELDNILADLLEKIPTKLSEAILKLSPQGIDRLLDYAEFLLERESSGSSAK